MEKGIKFALLATLVSGVSVYINKFALTAFSSPLNFTATKNFAVGLLIVGVLIISKKWSLIKTLTRGEIGKLVAIGIIGGSLPFYLFFTGLAQTSAVNAAILQKILVLWVAILAIPFLKEKLTLVQGVGILLLFYANTFIGGMGKITFGQGEIMILAATVLWAIETVIAKKALKTVDVDLVTGARMGLGAIILLFFGGLQPLTFPQLSWIAVTAVFLLAYVSFWYRALKFAPATVVTGILVAATLITNFLAAQLPIPQTLVMFLGAGLLFFEPLWSKRQDFFALLWSKP